MNASDPEETLRRLTDLRHGIDAIDDQLLALINRRLEIGQDIGKIKNKKGSGILDTSREVELLKRMTRQNPGPASEDLVRYLFNVIMTATKEIQRSGHVSFSGPQAGFSHMAALHYFCHCGRFVQRDTIREVFMDVEKKVSHFGVVPVENSVEGAVSHTLDLFHVFDVSICAEYYETTGHDLLSMTGELDQVETVCLSPHALSRSRGWLQRRLHHVTIQEVRSASRAVLMAKKDPSVAAVAVMGSGHIHGLQRAASHLEEDGGNVTRFLCLGHDRPGPTGSDKTAVMFVTAHSPGALFKVLAPLEASGLNMVKLESRPAPGQRWNYTFFMDIEGHIQDPLVGETLSRMSDICLSLKHLGSFPAAAHTHGRTP